VKYVKTHEKYVKTNLVGIIDMFQTVWYMHRFIACNQDKNEHLPFFNSRRPSLFYEAIWPKCIIWHWAFLGWVDSKVL